MKMFRNPVEALRICMNNYEVLNPSKEIIDL